MWNEDYYRYCFGCVDALSYERKLAYIATLPILFYILEIVPRAVTSQDKDVIAFLATMLSGEAGRNWEFFLFSRQSSLKNF
jgi:hypothetical protein